VSNVRVFANLNPFPVTVPCPKGGQQTIAPNEIVKGDWWTRLCGNRQLTEITGSLSEYNIVGRNIVQGRGIVRRNRHTPPVNELLSPPRRPKRRDKPEPETRVSSIQTLMDDVCQSGCEASCEAACELESQSIIDEEHMRIVAGQFFCKYCDYQSPKREDTETHMKSAHPEKVKDEMPAVEDTIEDKVSGPVGESKGKKDVKEDSDGTQKTIKEETEDYIEYEDGSFECKECGKVCKSKAGLASHINSKHRG